MEYSYLERVEMNRTFHMTKEGLDNLKKRLDTLMRERFELVKRLRIVAQEDKDQLILEDDIRQLEASQAEVLTISRILQHVEPIIKSERPTEVQIGSTVTVESDGKQFTYMIVCPFEVNGDMNKISEESPLGRGLLGKKLHDVISVPGRKQENIYKIVSIA